MTKVFAIGDLHGCLNKFENLLKYWNPDNQQLVLLGDLVDRGPDPLGCILKAMKLQQEYGAVIVQGNHEQLFLSYLEDPINEGDFYRDLGGNTTIDSFFDEERVAYRYKPERNAHLIKTGFIEEIDFIKNLPDYYEIGKYVFVHAGVNLNLKDWKKSHPNDFAWIREPFIYGRNDSNNIFVFGHTRTSYINKDKSNNVWFSPCKTKIGIDGSAVFGGYLHGLAIDTENNKIKIHSV